MSTRILQGKTVLIADDAEDIRSMLAMFLSSLGALVVEVNNGRSAVMRALSDNVDLALIDLHMPEMSGIDAAKSLKQTRPDLPILCLTGETSAGLSDPAFGQLFQGVLTKPTSLREVGAKASDLMQMKANL